ncbi:MAG: SDR family oxidoreductase [Bacteroidetes bacterium]|nr:MAG: SDR family oxidoreductase [Bacteroidota bacterium]TAG86997.1 MAG: SDR family oxidoreductase [Bacteroidota bacterium]
MLIIISGASRGIGKAIALRLAQKKCKIAILARNEEELLQTQTEMQAIGAEVLALACDITQEEAVKNAAQNIITTFGTPTILINNAGVGKFRTMADFSVEEFDNMMNVNIKGSFLLTKYFLPAMQQAQQGHIIAIASDVSKRTFFSGSLYCATKYAQDAMFSALRKEVRKDNIKVSVVYPGMVNTYFESNTFVNRPERLDADDIAQAVEYIISVPKNVVIDEITIHPLQQEY